ncbi:MAG TPA: (Fe-S)-binding protein [Actinomycetota bacterium]|nr:(Fe-S)-binding protein [Actinomycetota bacterium]
MLRPLPLLVMGAVTALIAGRRGWRLFRMVRSGQPDPERFKDLPRRIRFELTKVIGQRKLLQWSGPGIAHALTFWGFLVIQVALLESFGAFFSADFVLPFIGRHAWLGFMFDFFILAVTVSLLAFFAIRLKNNPRIWQRKSRFFKSHTAQAFVVLGMIFGVVGTLLLINAARHALGRLPYAQGAFLSRPLGNWMSRFGHGSLEAVEYAALVAHVGIVFSFLILVLYSKHLHIFTSPLNVLFGRHPLALGRLRPMHIDMETLDENSRIGVGSVEDFSFKHLLDGLTCTECGRCQSVCPAWQTGKELNPKLIVMNVRDHMFAKSPVMLGETTAEEATGEAAVAVGQRLVPDVISDVALWECVTCGACVYECPVDIEHVDMIVDMRRHQVMMESAFPRESVGMLNNLESTGNPWAITGEGRMDWAKGLDVPVVNGSLPSGTEYLFWVGCAGASDDRAKKTTRAVVTLLQRAGVKFAVLGPRESCTGDPARRIGNEFLFQELAKNNVETLNGVGVTKIITQCPHCFNTMAREYPDYGGNYEVIHHSQLLAKLVGQGRLQPETPLDLDVTYHDPCYLARHNDVTVDPRLVIRATGARQTEMHRCGKKTFCCGAGGARFWMEETEGKRINHERIDEALGANPDVVATACPFCLVMLDDAVKDRQMSGAGENVEVIDVAQVLVRSMNGTRPLAAVTSGSKEQAETKAPPHEGTGGEGTPDEAPTPQTRVPPGEGTGGGTSSD